MQQSLVCPRPDQAAPPFIGGEDCGRRGERDSEEGVTNIALLLSPRPLTSFIGSRCWGETNGWMKRAQVCNFMRFVFCADERVEGAALAGGDADRSRQAPPRWIGGDVMPTEELRDEARLTAALLSCGALECEIVAWLFCRYLEQLRTRCPFVTECSETLTFLGGRLFCSDRF